MGYAHVDLPLLCEDVSLLHGLAPVSQTADDQHSGWSDWLMHLYGRPEANVYSDSLDARNRQLDRLLDVLADVETSDLGFAARSLARGLRDHVLAPLKAGFESGVDDREAALFAMLPEFVTALQTSTPLLAGYEDLSRVTGGAVEVQAIRNRIIRDRAHGEAVPTPHPERRNGRIVYHYVVAAAWWANADPPFAVRVLPPEGEARSVLNE